VPLRRRHTACLASPLSFLDDRCSDALAVLVTEADGRNRYALLAGERDALGVRRYGAGILLSKDARHEVRSFLRRCRPPRALLSSQHGSAAKGSPIDKVHDRGGKSQLGSVHFVSS